MKTVKVAPRHGESSTSLLRKSVTAQTWPRPPLPLCGMKPTDPNPSLLHELARRLFA
jgi:hypothetical protein